MTRERGGVRQTLGRKAKAVIAIVSSAAVVLSAFCVAPSLAGWTRTEYDNGTVASLNCSSGAPFTTNSWAQEIAGQVAGVPLDSHLAGVLGLSVASATPHSTAVGGAGSSGLTYLGSDAWDSDLQVGALDSISLGVGVSLPVSQNTGAETQFARATKSGIATGASGAITTGGGGVVSLQAPTSTAPGVGSVGLDSALSATVGDELAGNASELTDASLDVGALGSITTLDSCNALWQGMSDAASVVRSYVLSKLDLDFSSSSVGTVVTDATNTAGTLGTTLNALQPNGTLVSASSVTTALATAINATTAPLAVTIGGPTNIEVGVAFNLAPALSVLSSTISDGPVSINLSSGQISVDLAALSGFGSLNSLPVNTKLIGPTTLDTLTTDIDGAINTAIVSTLKTAILNVLDAATVTVGVTTDVKLAGIDAATLTMGISGSVGQFLSPGTLGEPTVSISKVDAGGAASLLSIPLGLLGLSLDDVLATVLGNVVAPLDADLVPAIASGVLTPLLTTATSDVTSSIATLDGTTLAPLLASLGTVVGVIGDALEVTVNAEPDVVAGSVGAPEATTPGEFFESAVHIGVLDTVDSSSTLALFLGSSAAGPDAEN
ncbi:MAG TPA: choice-of-anchor G family protein [Galbitalea sp.]|jgi:hypothetical protein|nr:choice-of-anchor G family protein [Galbitalea sp.]